MVIGTLLPLCHTTNLKLAIIDYYGKVVCQWEDPVYPTPQSEKVWMIFLVLVQSTHLTSPARELYFRFLHKRRVADMELFSPYINDNFLEQTFLTFSEMLRQSSCVGWIWAKDIKKTLSILLDLNSVYMVLFFNI